MMTKYEYFRMPEWLCHMPTDQSDPLQPEGAGVPCCHGGGGRGLGAAVQRLQRTVCILSWMWKEILLD